MLQEIPDNSAFGVVTNFETSEEFIVERVVVTTTISHPFSGIPSMDYYNYYYSIKYVFRGS